MAVNKRGFLFTILAVIFVLVIITVTSSYQRLYPRMHSQTDRVLSMDRYLENLEMDLPRVMYIAGYRGLIGAEEHISATGQYLPDFETAFISVLTNGTINGSYYDIMNDTTFMNFSVKFASLASQQGIIANISVSNVETYQEDPWYVILNISVNVSLTDAARIAGFETIMVVSAAVPIDGIKDPVYSVGTQGRAPHTFSRSNLTRPYITATNDTTNLQLLVNQTLYINSTSAPSFVQRFEGNFSPSPHGVLSLVNIKELEAQGFTTDTCKSVVDFLYFGSQDTQTNYEIVNMDSDTFWLNATHFPDLDATGKDTGVKICT
jgi:hypothetical protein